MGASGSARRVKIFQHKKKILCTKCNMAIFAIISLNLIILLYKLSLMKYFHEIFGLAEAAGNIIFGLFFPGIGEHSLGVVKFNEFTQV